MAWKWQRAGRLCAAAIVVPALLLTGARGASAAPGPGVVDHAVTFTVQNVNHTSVACSADGGTYKVRGHLIAPVQSMTSPGAVTLLLHGLSYGEFFGDYQAQDGYNFARSQAEAGHAMVTIDRLGYGASDQPAGMGICFGSQADMAHQIIDKLKSGEYATNESAGPKFAQVVLAGHSVGGLIAQIVGYTFGNADGLAILSYSDTTVSLAAKTALKIAVDQCTAGGTLKNGNSGAQQYIYFGADTPAKFIEAHFYTPNADPAVVATTAGLRSRDPCGDVMSYLAAVNADNANIGKITAPTLVMTGGKDAIYPVPATEQASLLTGASSVTPITIPDTGHALVLHLSAPLVRTEFSKWLTDHNFGGMVIPTGSVDTGGGSAAGTDMAGPVVLGSAFLSAALLVWAAGRRRRANALR